MTDRLQTFLTELLALLTAALLAFTLAGQKPTSGGYQLFERAASGISADIQLVSFGNFAPSLETASECCNATNSAGGSTRIVPGGGLQAHEVAGGHLIQRHVGQTDADLIAGLNAQPNITAASSFPNIFPKQGNS